MSTATERPERRAPADLVLTGFIGSGKTTVLAIAAEPGMATPTSHQRVGEIGLDHLLVASASEDMVVMKADCLCCRCAATWSRRCATCS